MRAGIWQGRFQVIHNGHYHVFKTTLKNFDEKFVAIVNPNPKVEPYRSDTFDRFRTDCDRNPLSYFDRMLLWKILSDEQNMDALFFPCWHARLYVELENDFLPERNHRSWIVPVLQNTSEQAKKRDLEARGEQVTDSNYREEPLEVRGLSATEIRDDVRERRNIQDKVPACISDLTVKLCNGKDPHKYYIIPFIDDKISLFALQYAYNCVSQEDNSYIVFMVSVPVQNGEKEWKDKNNLPWWFKPAQTKNRKFYVKARRISNVMRELGFSKYLITPVFVMNDDINQLEYYNNAFLPGYSASKFIIGEDDTIWEKKLFPSWVEDYYSDLQIADAVITADVCSVEKIFESQLGLFSFSKKMKSNDSSADEQIDAICDTYLKELTRKIEKTKQTLKILGKSSSETVNIESKYSSMILHLKNCKSNYSLQQIKEKLMYYKEQWENECNKLCN